MYYLRVVILEKMKKISAFCWVCILLFACKNTNKSFDSTEYGFSTKTIRWDLNKDFEIKEIVKNIQCIILEDTPESIFSTINKLIIKNDRIYILDIEGARSLLVFDINGKFIHKIGKQGNGPGEYSRSLINFTVNENDDVLLYDYAKRKMMRYDKNGKYIELYRSSFSFNDFIFLSNDQYLLSLDIYEKKNSNRKVMLTNDLNIQGEFFFYFHKNFKHNKLNVRTFQPNVDKIAYMHPVNDTLFIFDNEGFLKQAWFFDFGSKKLAEELKNDYEKAVEEEKEGNSHSIHIFNTPICIKNYIIAEMIVNNQKCISVYDTTNNKLAYELLTPNKFSLNNINFPLCTVHDSLLVSYLDPDTYLVVKDNFSISPEIDKHLENGGVIILLNTIN